MKLCKDCDYFCPDPNSLNRLAKCGHPDVLDHVTGDATSSCSVIRAFDCKDGRLFKPRAPEILPIKISRIEKIQKKVSSLISFMKKPLSEHLKLKEK